MSETIFGIDLGTTNSAIAYVDPVRQQVVVIPNQEGAKTTPSVVQIPPHGQEIVGAIAKAEVAFYPEATAQFFKRDMGSDTTYEYSGRVYTPVDLSACVLGKLKSDAEAYLQRPVRRVVITVPAYFHDDARNATVAAGRQAGLEVVHIINEPTAAILSYGLDKAQNNSTVLIYDLGGGTFDVTLAKVTSQGITVIATDGNHALGGKDWDDRLLSLLGERFSQQVGIHPLTDPLAVQPMLVAIEQLKRELSNRERASASLTAAGHTLRIEVSRAEFEAATSDLLEQTLMLVERMIADAQFTPGQIDQLLLVGGSTRMPMCSKRLQAFWGRLPGSVLNPDECVATGAALQAALLAGTTFSKSTGLLKNKPEVRDVTAHSLGYIMASADNSRFVNSIILKRNSPIPVENAQRRLLPTRPNDTNELDVYLLQGESTRPLDNSLLGKYTFGEVPHYKGETEVRIEYRYNSDGMVEVRAFDQHSGKALKGPQITRDGLDISWSDQSPKEIQQSGRCVIYLAFDLSGSMEGKPLQEAKRAAHAFVGQCNLQNTLVGLIAFSDTSNVDLVATNDAKAIATAIERLSSGKTGYGNDTDPFEAIQRQLEQEEGLRYAIVLADGVWEDQSRAVQRAKRCHALGIQVVAVGFGGADKRFLQQISSSSTQSFFTDLNSLTSTFSSIARDIATAGLSR